MGVLSIHWYGVISRICCLTKRKKKAKCGSLLILGCHSYANRKTCLNPEAEVQIMSSRLWCLALLGFTPQSGSFQMRRLLAALAPQSMREGPAWVTVPPLCKGEKRTEWWQPCHNQMAGQQGRSPMKWGHWTQKDKRSPRQAQSSKTRQWEETISKFVHISKFHGIAEPPSLGGFQIEGAVDISSNFIVKNS